MMQSVLEHARYYVSKGFSVIPLVSKDKRPAIASWEEFQKKYPTDEELIEWFDNGSNNIGIVTGAISNIAVVEVSNKTATHSIELNSLPLTPFVKSPKGYLTFPPNSRHTERIEI